MSYQFEDDSAMDELLAKQLERHKKQPPPPPAPLSSGARTPASGQQPRPSTGATPASQEASQPPSQSQPQLRPVSSAGLARQTTLLEREAATDSTSRGRLASWLASSKDETSKRRDSAGSAEPSRRPANELLLRPTENLDELLTDQQLQEMSKQRLVQLILERLRPSLEAARQAAISGKGSAGDFERLNEELRREQIRFELAELRHQEMVKLNEEKWIQTSKQLETRLEASEREMSHLLAAQREHLAKLDEQYQANLVRLGENYEQRLRAEQTRFNETLKRHDELHKLELESKLNVNFDLAQLEAIQSDWRRALELTIGQLNDQFKSTERLLDKQAHQVNGTNTELAKRTGALCEQFDKHDATSRRLDGLASSLAELVPRLAGSQETGELVLRELGNKLEALGEQTNELTRRHEQLEASRTKLEAEREQFQANRIQLMLDSQRLSLKEERANELIKSNCDAESRLNNQRQRQLEEEAHLQTKRVHLEAESNELRELNLSLHQLRKRLTSKKEELIKAQCELEEAQRALKSRQAQLEGETNRLEALGVRARRELDQLRRLQRSLVCSLCMSRLFDDGGYNGGNNQSIEPVDELQLLLAAADCRRPDVSSLGRLLTAAGQPVAKQQQQRRATIEPAGGGGGAQRSSVEVQPLRRHVERDSSLVAAESKFVELLASTN